VRVHDKPHCRGNDYERKAAVSRAMRSLKQFECIAITSKEKEPVLVKVTPVGKEWQE
jgi:hypothetical protein